MSHAVLDIDPIKVLYALQIALFNAEMNKEKEVYVPTFDKPSKLIKLERTNSGALCFVSNKSAKNSSPVAIVTIPKADTYFLARVLTKLGYIDTRIHVAEERMSDYREYDINNFTDGDARSRKIPLTSQISLVSNGSFFTSHLLYSNAELLQGRSILLSVRDLRAAIISRGRYLAEKNASTNSERLTEQNLYDFMASERVKDTIASAKSMLQYKEKYPNNLLQFEEIAQAPLSEHLTSVKNLASILDKDVSLVVTALNEARGEQTLTFSGKHSTLDGLWSNRVEEKFKKLEGHILNEQLGYAKEWKNF